MEIWAHRGRTSQGQIGNKLSNFLSVYNLGITGLETDICLTKDGKIIIYHPRSTTPDLTSMTWDEIRCSAPDVIDLDFFLYFLEIFEMYCCLEVKQYSPKLVREAVKGITEHHLEDKVYLTAFQRQMNYPPFNIESDGRLLLMAKEINPDIKTHVIVTWPFNLLKIADKYQPDMISFGWLQEPPIMGLISRSVFKTLSLSVRLSKQIEEIKLRKKKVLAGIFNNPQEILYFSEMGVDGIMTDEPKILMDLIQDRRI